MHNVLLSLGTEWWSWNYIIYAHRNLYLPRLNFPSLSHTFFRHCMWKPTTSNTCIIWQVYQSKHTISENFSEYSFSLRQILASADHLRDHSALSTHLPLKAQVSGRGTRNTQHITSPGTILLDYMLPLDAPLSFLRQGAMEGFKSSQSSASTGTAFVRTVGSHGTRHPRRNGDAGSRQLSSGESLAFLNLLFSSYHYNFYLSYFLRDFLWFFKLSILFHNEFLLHWFGLLAIDSMHWEATEKQ